MHPLKTILLMISPLAAVTSGASVPAPVREAVAASATDMPASWRADLPAAAPITDDGCWWRPFGDPALDSLMTLVTANNQDLSMAARRIAMASEALRQTRSAWYPAVGVNAGWTRARTSGATTSPSVAASTMSYFDLGLNMSWQIDIFGKVRSQARAGEAAVKASAAEYGGMQLTVCAKAATAYVQLRALQARRQVLESNIAQQKRVMQITEARHEAGLSSMLDVSQARTNYYSTLATASTVETSIATTINGIAVLAGVYPEQIAPWLSQPRELPACTVVPAAGVPADLLRRRPDIAQAEYTLAEYAARLGVARKDFLPTLTLTGSLGTQARDASDLFSGRSVAYSVTPTLSWTVFDGMARSAAAAQAREQMMWGIDNYNNTVLTAVQEVDNALTAYSNDMRYIDDIDKVVAQATESFDLSLDMYKQGLSAFINVAQAQITLLQYSNELVTARATALTDLIDLCQALGGGWQMPH